MTTELWAMGLVLFGTVIGAFGALFLKKGSAKFSFNIIKLLKNTKLLLGVFLYGISSVPFIIALRGGELSVLYPLVAVGYVWIALLSIKFLNERMNKYKWMGIIFIILGVALIGAGSV